MNSTTDYPSTELATFSHLDQTLSERLLGLDLVLFPALCRDPFDNTKQRGSIAVVQLLHWARNNFYLTHVMPRLLNPNRLLCCFKCVCMSICLYVKKTLGTRVSATVWHVHCSMCLSTIKKTIYLQLFQSGCFRLLMLNPDIVLSTYIGPVQQIVNALYLGPCNKHYIICNTLLININ